MQERKRVVAKRQEELEVRLEARAGLVRVLEPLCKVQDHCLEAVMPGSERRRGAVGSELLLELWERISRVSGQEEHMPLNSE